MIDFQIGEQQYRADALDAFTQLHIGRRLSPWLAAMAESDGSQAQILAVLGQAPQADIDYVLRAVLGVVKRKNGAVWAPIYHAEAGRLMFEDISGIELLDIAAGVVQDFLGPFFLGLVSRVSGTPSPTDAS